MHLHTCICIFSFKYDTVMRRLIWSQQLKPDIKLFSLIIVQIAKNKKPKMFVKYQILLLKLYILYKVVY